MTAFGVYSASNEIALLPATLIDKKSPHVHSHNERMLRKMEDITTCVMHINV